MILSKFKVKTIKKFSIKKKIENFKFLLKGKRLGRLFIRRSFTNLFITLTDINNKVVYTMSAGRYALNNNSKIKNSPITFDNILVSLRKVLRTYNLKFIELILRSRLIWQIKTLHRNLIQYGFIITKFVNKRITPHNGVRSKNQRRR